MFSLFPAAEGTLVVSVFYSTSKQYFSIGAKRTPRVIIWLREYEVGVVFFERVHRGRLVALSSFVEASFVATQSFRFVNVLSVFCRQRRSLGSTQCSEL